ncbi:MAG: class A beta-lactamase-related serine hydrolase [Treponema sp.]|nr:class A beta-lactamase-related serine hydrolase [Treponema sp.]
MSKEQVIKVMDQHAGMVKGKIGLGYKNFKTGDEYYINGDEPFPAASTFKVPVLIELFRQAKEGKLSITDTYTLKPEDIAPGSGILSFLTPGMSMSLKDHAMLMMIISDNTCTDALVRILGKDNIKAAIESMGLKNTRVDFNCREIIHSFANIPLDLSIDEVNKLFKEEKFEANYALFTDMTLPNDISSPKDMMTMFTMIYNGEVVSPDACRQMMDIMEKCQTNTRIPALLPMTGPKAVRAIHKTGTLQFVTNDCGIVITPQHTYGLMMYYNSFTGDKGDKTFVKNDAILAEISRDVYNALHGA